MADAHVFTPFLPTVQRLEGENNWHRWKKDMEMVFSADGESWEIVTGQTVSTESDSRDEKRKLQQKDKVAFAIICSLLHTSVRTIIDDLTTKTGSAAYQALKAKYKAFHSIIHDPAHPIKIYLSTMKTARQRLQDIGVTIDNTYYKDLILANLDKSYGQIRMSLLSSDATIEPTIQAVISTLENAGPVIDFDPDAPVPAVIKEEHVEVALMDQEWCREEWEWWYGEEWEWRIEGPWEELGIYGERGLTPLWRTWS
ncbi:hypothetical protein AAF712_016553 [Marasmius tenuissimus]|uniref:DUF4219 domain-containing protein n=1 Tax=Marasmius tenuissimus TaxID=585030 RepID=A0ABR2Z7C1_9AGAR